MAEEEKILRVDKTKRRYKFELPKTKFTLIREILKRWWYGLPVWPNPDADYSEDLASRKLRVVEEKDWNNAPLVDNGMEKVRKVPAFPGIFKDSKGNLYDLRNNTTKPSFRNLKKKEIKDLVVLLRVCLKNQIRALEKSEYYENNLDFALRKFYKKFTDMYSDFLNKDKAK